MNINITYTGTCTKEEYSPIMLVMTWMQILEMQIYIGTVIDSNINEYSDIKIIIVYLTIS